MTIQAERTSYAQLPHCTVLLTHATVCTLSHLSDRTICNTKAARSMEQFTHFFLFTFHLSYTTVYVCVCVYVFSVVLFRTLLFASLLCSAVELIELRKIDGLFGLSPNIHWLGRAAFRLLSIVAFFSSFSFWVDERYCSFVLWVVFLAVMAIIPTVHRFWSSSAMLSRRQPVSISKPISA